MRCIAYDSFSFPLWSKSTRFWGMRAEIKSEQISPSGEGFYLAFNTFDGLGVLCKFLVPRRC